MDDAVDKLQAFYKVYPVERVQSTIKTGSNRSGSGNESQDRLEFKKCLLHYYDKKAAEFEDSSLQKTTTYNRSAVETLYEATSTVNFFG